MLKEPSLKLLSAALFALLFALYNLNFRHGFSVDTIPATALSASIAREANLDLDEFRQLLSTNTNALDASLIYFGAMQERHGRLVTSYPLGSSLLAAPFFWAADKVGYLREWHHYRVAGKIAASFMVALSAVFIFLTLGFTISTRAAWVLALFFGLGTPAWPLSSQELWQHGPGTLCLAIGVYALFSLAKTSSQKFALIAGLFLGLAVLCRLLNVIPVAALSCFILAHQRKYSAAFFLPLIAIAIPLALYNIEMYGHLSGGYDAIYQSKWHAWRGLSSETAYDNLLPQGFADVLISPSRGLLVFSSFLLPALIAAMVFVIRPNTRIDRYLAIWVLVMIVVLAKNTLWWGGSSFGPRYFSETCVALVILTGSLWHWLTQYRLLHGMFVASAVTSIALNGLGAFSAPCGWADTPNYVDQHPERLWDWQDSEIPRCLKFAIENGPKPPEILIYKSGNQDF